MWCTPIPGGLVCRGGRRPRCKTCGGPSERQCDFKLKGSKRGKTCDQHMCSRCAVPQGKHATGAHAGDTIDYCPAHARLAADAKQEPGEQLELGGV
jgi:hypothetical protein